MLGSKWMSLGHLSSVKPSISDLAILCQTELFTLQRYLSDANPWKNVLWSLTTWTLRTFPTRQVSAISSIILAPCPAPIFSPPTRLKFSFNSIMRYPPLR
ncbi:hypothetical protein I314_04451 [Cryptococcus bacillisporus CA1873]|uniref:Uncharacterized protein n=1 Tax=Cryptococcus bacillisporus CA1873 TaxID=1296111 RepID=A0ABR5B7A9_CRYGA|nr:hypothetical protein I314_04451 [Cryptococcus bacillisporus CA1873]|eukprot:KIR59466.1 hypothetical protein I314_04451 [Cryptococcus gattii CA1873]